MWDIRWACLFMAFARALRDLCLGLFTAAGRQTTCFNDFSIEAGILLRGNGVPHAMLDIHVLFVRGLPDAVVSQPTQLSLIPTPTHGPYLLQTLRSLSLTSLPSLS